MANITIFVPDDVKKRMSEYEDVRWSKAIRSIIEQRLAGFEEAERLAQKSKLTQADAGRLAAEVDNAAGRHAEYLLKHRGVG